MDNQDAPVDNQDVPVDNQDVPVDNQDTQLGQGIQYYQNNMDVIFKYCSSKRNKACLTNLNSTLNIPKNSYNFFSSGNDPRITKATRYSQYAKTSKTTRVSAVNFFGIDGSGNITKNHQSYKNSGTLCNNSRQF